MKYKNPILSGCYPDPSVCRAGDDFYLVNSTFEFFPGVPVWHSRNLVDWELIGHCISRKEQLCLNTGSQNNTGIFAPTIRFHDGIFYMITTNVGEGRDIGNFYVWTKDPAGEWSDPVFLETPGIDPSLFFDDDGRAWYTGTADAGIYIQEIDLKEGKLLGQPVSLWKGTGGAYPEGPHIYKKDGWYYLLISEGGTERCHMLTMARSRNLTGGYEVCPYNPVLTNRSLPLPIQSVGHADLVQAPDGSWWAVCLGTRTFSYPPRHNLGRETMLAPVDFSGEWPVFGANGCLAETFEGPSFAGPFENAGTELFRDDFAEPGLKPEWNLIYNPETVFWKTGEGGLRLLGNEKRLCDAERTAWVGRRQRHHDFESEVKLTFDCSQEGEEAGLAIFMNHRHHYEAALIQEAGRRKLILRRQIGSLWKVEKEIDYAGRTVWLRLTGSKERYEFQYRSGQEQDWMTLGSGETIYLTTEGGGHFTGNYIALYSMGNGTPCRTQATFESFLYRGGENK